jgi:hypothetical protein
MKRPLRRQWYDAVDAGNDANQLLVLEASLFVGWIPYQGAGAAGVAEAFSFCLTTLIQEIGGA